MIALLFVEVCPALTAALELPRNRLRWPVVDDSRSGGKQGGTDTRFRAVGHGKGSKQLLNTSAGAAASAGCVHRKSILPNKETKTPAQQGRLLVRF
jgi:hypothetical protein